MQELYYIIKDKKRSFWFITLGYIAFNGCFMFPFNRMMKSYTDPIFYTVIVAYGIIGLFFVGLLRKKSIKVYLLTLLFTAIGMVLRYLLEFGEVSNTVNFTIHNILLSLFAIPLFVTFIYWLLPRYIQYDKHNQ